jgi:hypothetical protein
MIHAGHSQIHRPSGRDYFFKEPNDMEMNAPLKDRPEVQRERITRLVSQLNENLRVDFYDNIPYPSRTDIRFRLVDTSTGADKIVGSIRQNYEWSSSEIADKSDPDLLRLIVVVRTK